MDRLDAVALCRELVGIPSVTGDEGPLARHVATLCETLGLEVRLHEVEPGRPNLLATRGEPVVLLCTHLDTVPPHIEFVEDGEVLRGRGVCDAKGIMAAMLVAAERLLEAGRQSFGLLLLVGEETDSLGAKRANAELALPTRHIVVGEPTGNRLATAQKGILTAQLTSHGRAGHGAYPEAGRSALRPLVEVLADLYRLDWGRSPERGANVLNIGLVKGGVAANVIPSFAEATVQVRVATSVADIESRLIETVAGRLEIDVRQRTEALDLGRLEGFETTVAGFGTDIPYLPRLGQPYLIGPGSILDAHTAGEKLEKAELHRAVELYVSIVERLLNED